MNPEKIVEEHAKSKKVLGISVGLIKDSEEFFNYGQIKKDSEIAPTKDTIFEIGSMTKTFTAILAVKLQEEGILSLDENISKYLPELENSEFEKKNVTLHHLLTHTSGLSEFSITTFASQMFAIMSTGKSQIAEYNYPTEEFLKYCATLKLKHIPGTTFLYSNIGFGLAGKIMEKLTGKTYDELVRLYICNVLDMKDTGSNILDSQKNRLATGYSFRGKQSDYWQVPAIEAAGGLCSTTSDMIKFLKANLGIVETKLTPVFEYCVNTKSTPKIPLSMKFFTKSMGISLSAFRFGWFVFPQKSFDVIGHDGGTEGFTSFMGMNLDGSSGVVILTNKAFKPVHKLGTSLL